jgi:hypothetical protein
MDVYRLHGMLAIVQAQVLLWMGMNFRFSI